MKPKPFEKLPTIREITDIHQEIEDCRQMSIASAHPSNNSLVSAITFLQNVDIDGCDELCSQLQQKLQEKKDAQQQTRRRRNSFCHDSEVSRPPSVFQMPIDREPPLTDEALYNKIVDVVQNLEQCSFEQIQQALDDLNRLTIPSPESSPQNLKEKLTHTTENVFTQEVLQILRQQLLSGLTNKALTSAFQI